MGIGVGKCVGVWGRKGRYGERYERRCRKVCCGVGEVRGDVRKNEGSEVREEIWGSVLGPHTLTHFPTPSSFLYPHLSRSCQHTSPLTPYTSLLIHPHTSFLTHPHTPTHFPTPPPHLFPHLPPTPQPTSSLTPCTLPHLSPHLPPQFGLCGKVTMRRCYLHKLNWTVEKPDKNFYNNQEFKVLFWCRQCKFSMYESVAKLPCGKVTVAKLPCGEVTGNHPEHGH